MPDVNDSRSPSSRHPDGIADAVAPALEALGLELFDVELSGSGRARTLRVFVDRAPGDDRGVDLDTITEATEALSPLLDSDPRIAAVLPGP